MLPLSLRQTTHSGYAYRYQTGRTETQLAGLLPDPFAKRHIRRGSALSSAETRRFKPQSLLRYLRGAAASIARLRAPLRPKDKSIREREQPIIQKESLSRRAPAAGRGTEQDEM